ncbi:DUF3667 domain-containing protein [Robiginitalea sp. IMCC44478]|uniref:DUF3667 domain-containing protein n=1 Tax=Robiginitalea sp. IMCC44478 TaxID=3459122 RepID=UPI00404126FD
METKPAKTAGRYQLRFRGTECLNCGHPLDMSDKYCPNCSQANSTKKLTMKDFMDEFLSSLIDYDSRLWKSLVSLLTRPGRISLDYIAGKRVSYSNPFRFLLSLAFIYFLLIGFAGNLGDLDNVNLDSKLNSDPDSEFTWGLGTDQFSDAAQQVMDSLETEGKIDSKNLANSIVEAQRKKDSAMIADPKGYLSNLSGKGFTERFIEKSTLFFKLIHEDTLFSYDDAAKKYELDDKNENRVAFDMAKSVQRALQRPGSFLSDFMTKLPFATFFFLPLFTVFVWGVYIRKNYTYTDNLIFSFHNQSLLFILLIISFLIDLLLKIDSSGIFLLVFGFYLYKAMRNFYKQGRFKTILKFLILNTIFFILALMAGVAFFVGSAITY